MVSNATAQRFPDKTLISFTNCLPEQLNLEYQWEVTISETCYPSIYRNVTEKNLVILDRKFSKTSESYSLESGLYPSITERVEVMNSIIQERHDESKTCITVEVSRGTQKNEIYFANERYVLAFFSTVLGDIFGGDVGNEIGVMLRRKGPNKPKFTHKTVRIHSLMSFADLMEFNLFGDTRSPHCGVAFLFVQC